ncbi:MAG: RES family NAD+ phosphorylase [Bermanella sp.]
MMKLWRISNYADLSGIGGTKTPGRWHNKGIPVVYLAESPALAMLEVLVHFEIDAGEVPKGYQLLEVALEDSDELSLTLSDEFLVDDWKDDLEFTRTIGDEWLTSSSSLLLKVPSIIVPNSYNYLFNPRHPEAKNAVIKLATKHPYDPRLTK